MKIRKVGSGVHTSRQSEVTLRGGVPALGYSEDNRPEKQIKTHNDQNRALVCRHEFLKR